MLKKLLKIQWLSINLVLLCGLGSVLACVNGYGSVGLCCFSFMSAAGHRIDLAGVEGLYASTPSLAFPLTSRD